MANVLDELKENLVKEWDETDENLKAEINEEYDKLSRLQGRERREAYETLYQKYGSSKMDLRYESSENIHKANVRDAEKMINNLVQRVEKKIGKITDYSGAYLSRDNNGGAILNGWFTGENGSCEVRSIVAGGYNIQKRHIRVLVK